MLIRGGTVVGEGRERLADVRIAGERIAEVAPDLTADPGEEVVDAAGKLVIPGGVDAHTHLGMPIGQIRVSDDFASGTRAAAIGGTTTVIDYATAYRGEDPLAALETWRRWAEPSVIDWSLHLTLTEPVAEDVVESAVAQGVRSIKLYMAYPDRLQVDDDTIADILALGARYGALVTVHAESGDRIEELRREALAAGRTGVAEHARTRPAELEGEATVRAARLAEDIGAALYVVHVSSANALAAIRAAQERGAPVLAETCPQYLYLDASRLQAPDSDAANFVCTPPLRDPWHSEELWHGLSEGWLHTVATDHCPFWVADRRAGLAGRADGFADFTEVPGGLPGIETRLALIWEGVRAGRLSATDWVRLCAEAPAQLFGLWPRKGRLAPGSDADIVVWDPERAQSLSATALHMAVDHSPYEDRSVTGWPALVLSRGRVVARDGEFTGTEGAGAYLPRDEPLLSGVSTPAPSSDPHQGAR